MSTSEIFEYEFKAAAVHVNLPRKRADMPKHFARRAAPVTPVRSYAHSPRRINTENRSSSPVRRSRVRSPSPKKDRKLRSTSVQKWNAALSKLRFVKAFEKATKGNVTTNQFPSYQNTVSVVPPADRSRANVAIFRAPLRRDRERAATYA
jgi:hypothetical protein